MAWKRKYYSFLFLNFLLTIQGICLIVTVFYNYISQSTLNFYTYSDLGFGLLLFVISFLGYLIQDSINYASLYLSAVLIALSYQMVILFQVLVYGNIGGIVIWNWTFTVAYLILCYANIFALCVAACCYRSYLHKHKKTLEGFSMLTMK